MQTVSPNGTRGANSSAQLPHGNANGVPQIDEQMIRSLCRCSNPRCDCQKDEGNVHCPAHDDNSPSLSVTTTGDGKTLFKCHSGCTQDAVLTALRGVPAPLPSIRSNIAQKPAKSRANGTFSWQHATIYPYTDETGATLFEVGRIGNGAEKRISQRKPNGRGGWLYQLTDVRRVPYRLPEVLAAQIVFVCEGEKAADAVNGELAEAGLQGEYIATTSPHGAGKWRDEYAEILSGKTVCVLPDNDEQGSSHADAVCRSCGSAGAVVKRLELPKLPVKGDAADFLSSGGTVEKLINLFDAAAAWMPAADETAKPKPAPIFEVWGYRALRALPPLSWLIDLILPEGGDVGSTSWLTAKSGDLKSFWAIDAGLCVSTGTPFHGRDVRQGNVVYVAAEGSAGLPDRMDAWAAKHQIEVPDTPAFSVIRRPVDVFNAGTLAQFAETVRALKPVFIILDTQSRCSVGHDMNSTAEATAFFQAVSNLARELKAQIMIVAHNNRTGDYAGNHQGQAMVDTHLTMKRNGKSASLRCLKQKDGAPEEAAAMDFETRVYDLGTRDEKGREITSLALVATDLKDEPEVPKTDTKGAMREAVLEVLKCDFPKGTRAKEWQLKCEALGICKSSAFYDRRDELKTSENVSFFGGVYLYIESTPPTPPTPPRSKSECAELRPSLSTPPTPPTPLSRREQSGVAEWRSDTAAELIERHSDAEAAGVDV
jgi:hypothetical protein